jgi:hypothetical protein
MEASAAPTVIKAPVANAVTKSHNPGLRALLAIKKFTATLEKDHAGLLQMEVELDASNKIGWLLIEANASAAAAAQWKLNVQEINNAVTGINDTLTLAQEKIRQKQRMVLL